MRWRNATISFQATAAHQRSQPACDVDSTENNGWAGPAQPVRQGGGPAATRVEVAPPARQVAARVLLHIPQLHAI